MRSLQVLAVQLGLHKDYPDVTTLATTYNDGLYYVASFLQRELPEVQLELCQMLWGEDPADFPLESYDYILISALSTHFWSNISALELLQKRKQPHCKIIIGGPHATFAPHEALQYADYVILGEGEVPTLQLIQTLEAGGDLDEVENLCYLAADGVLTINRFARYGDLDNTINPVLLQRAPRLHWATISMSRGCPYNCSFCYAIRLLGRRFRPQKCDTIVQELDSLHQQTGCTRFYVTDLNFTTREDFCYDVAAALQDRSYRFVAMSRIEFADNLDLVHRLRTTGFHEYTLGVESEDPDVLRTFNKGVDASLQMERLRRFADNDIIIHSAIIFGHEAQDQPAIERTARWTAEAGILHPAFVCLAEYPFQTYLYGSHQDIEDHRIIMELPTYQHYSFVGIFPRHMRPSTLQQAIHKSYEVFFERALEVETRQQRRIRLKSYARSVKFGLPGMERHIRILEEIEKPYYTTAGTLKEDRLRADFEAKYGVRRDWLQTSVRRHPDFTKAFKR